MTFDSDGRDLAYQAERLAADKQDAQTRLAANLVTAGIVLLTVAAAVYSFISWRVS